ncbi:hypothetical protein LUZ62_076253 [Rhynchospora pubera]|uniref:NB-ARC domain-containing protein n=1 Tax=Rhynchospora pubera TaxID=906938 RepID=A0AAV8DI21_9POAL|nr:hypothetical protein LUZ62_076253 [Rhynchospora pubera]
MVSVCSNLGYQIPCSVKSDKLIRSTFAKITEDRIALQLSEDDGPRRCSSDMQIVPTSHFVVKSGIIGREREKKKLINLLSSESNDGNIISVVTIVGAGGIGKTTLAQLVYNDQNFRQNFDKVGWIFVAQDFNVHRLSRELGESMKKRSLDFTNLSALQENISEEMRGKKIFLVLDDVWKENKNLWELFQLPFMSASLVKILVITRNKSVARLMQTEPDATYNIPYMSEEQSWQMFQHFAFGKVVPHADSNFVEIGKEIMRKCGKLPLAIKSIAKLLRHEPNEENWKEILESELWESDAKDEIFWPLLISYAHLPTYLKPCFLYCSLLPKYYSNDAEKMSSSRRTYFNDAEILVKLWISQGYVQTEKIGWIYVKQLYERSFLEGIGVLAENIFCFTMHDIVHDLARSILGNGCFSIVGNTILNFPEELRHLYVHYSQKEPLEPPLFPSDTFATLRTLIVDDHGHLLPKKKQIVKDYLGKQFLSAFDISNAHKLRALHLWIRGYLKFDISFEKLKHLRYLFLGGKAFERLPECICSLYKLQNLTLQDFPYLMELPESIKNLVSLEELTITRCPSLKVLPVSFNQLKALQKLCISWCTAFEELPCNMGNLTNLQLLEIDYTEIISLPPSLNKIIRRTSLQVRLVCKTIGWLENFVDL